MQRLSKTTNPTDPLACAEALLDSLPAVVWFIRSNMRRHRSAGLSVPQFRTLVLLQRYPYAALSHIAEHLGATLPTASRLVSGLVRKGLVTRRDDSDDRRRLSLRLTGKGETTLRAARRATRRRVADALGRGSAAERKLLGGAAAVLKRLFDSTSPDRVSRGRR